MLPTLTLDPEERKRQDPRSPLKKAIDKSSNNGIPGQVDVCPFGCTIADMDEIGYCRHLVGFSNCNLPDGKVKDPKGAIVELIETHNGRRCVRAKRGPLRTGDVVYRITNSRRVYRDIDADLAELEAAQVARKAAQIEKKAGEEKPPAKPTPAPLEAPLG